MRLIDADAVLAEIMDFIDEYSEVDGSGLHNPKWCAMEEAKDVILNAPTVDAVPVVRCKDCKYQHMDTEFCKPCIKAKTRGIWFCADGERRGGND